MIKLKFTLAAAAAMVLVGCSTTTTTMAPIEDHATTAPAATSVPVNEGSSQMVTPYLAKENAKDSGRTHTVVAGDTLYNIGVRYGVNPREIASLNGITDPTTMSLGLVLKIPEAATKAPEATSATETTVAGETVVVTTTAETEKPVTVEVAKRPDTPEEAAQSELAQAESLRKAAARACSSAE